MLEGDLQFSVPVGVQISMLSTDKTLAYVTVTCVEPLPPNYLCRGHRTSAIHLSQYAGEDKATSAPNCDQPYPKPIPQLHDWCSPPCFPAVSVRLHCVPDSSFCFELNEVRAFRKYGARKMGYLRKTSPTVRREKNRATENILGSEKLLKNFQTSVSVFIILAAKITSHTGPTCR